jgi:hypothetical protein
LASGRVSFLIWSRDDYEIYGIITAFVGADGSNGGWENHQQEETVQVEAVDRKTFIAENLNSEVSFMQTMWKRALAVLLSLCIVQNARAELTLNGAVGLPLNPTARIPSPDNMPVQGNFYELGKDFAYYGLFTALRVKNRPLEISGGIDRLDNHDNQAGISIGAKYLLSGQDDSSSTRLALGVGYSHALGQNIHAYAVASKPVVRVGRNWSPVMAHLGLRYDRFEDVGGEIGLRQKASDKASIYGGVEIPLTRRGTFMLTGEVQSKNHEFNSPPAKTPYSASVSYRSSNKGFAAAAGIQRQGLTGESRIMFTLTKFFGR